jgi:hypothetical protein
MKILLLQHRKKARGKVNGRKTEGKRDKDKNLDR